MNTATLHVIGAFAAGLALTLFLAAYLTPRQWWRRLNVRALLIAVGGTWCIGSLILHGAHPSATDGGSTGNALAATVNAAAARDETPQTAAASPATAQLMLPAIPSAAGNYIVHRDLNLRSAAGVNAARLVTVPAGASVTATGAHSGDWWQIRANIGGRESTGWVSSLWLRRGGE